MSPFRTRRRIFLLLLLPVVVCAWGFTFGWHRPYINWMPWDLAQYLVTSNRPVSECNDLIWFEIMSPPQAEQRALCIYEYAHLAHDPSACELLMPSEYGLFCINDVISGEYTGHMDSGFFPASECETTQTDPLKQDWCSLLKAHATHRASDCETIQNQAIRTGCILKFDAWSQYPSLRNSFYFGNSASSAQ